MSFQNRAFQSNAFEVGTATATPTPFSAPSILERNPIIKKVTDTLIVCNLLLTTLAPTPRAAVASNPPKTQRQLDAWIPPNLQSTTLAPTGQNPFSNEEFGNPPSRPRVKDEVVLNLLTTTLGVVTGTPFTATDTSGLPIRPSGHKDDTPENFLPLTATTTPPFTPTDFTIPVKISKGKDVEPPNLMLTAMSAVPFTPPDFTTAKIKTRRPEEAPGSLVLTAISPVPFVPPDFTTAKIKTRRPEEYPGTLALTAMAPVPFIPQEFQAVPRPRLKIADLLDLNLLGTTLAPTGQNQFSNSLDDPRAKKRARPDETTPDLLTTTLVVTAGTPFTPQELPNAKIRTRRPEEYPGTLALTAMSAVPFTPQELPNAKIRTRRPEEYPGSPILTTTAAVPFLPRDFERVPIRVRRVDEYPINRLALTATTQNPFVNPDWSINVSQHRAIHADDVMNLLQTTLVSLTKDNRDPAGNTSNGRIETGNPYNTRSTGGNTADRSETGRPPNV